MRVLVACPMPTDTLEHLRALVQDVIYLPELSAEELPNHIAGVGILVYRTLRVSAAILQRADALQLLIHSGSGPGDVAIEDASAAGVFVTHCPDQHATAVAELTLGLIVALDRRIVDNALACRAGTWDRAALGQARGLAGRTLGILGYGEIGRRVARRARAFDMRVLAWSAQLGTEAVHEPGVEFRNWPRELARTCDVLTLHATGEDEDEPDVIVDAEFLENVPPGTSLVHVGNPSAIDHAALARAIEQKQLRVALDVHSSEPLVDNIRTRVKLCDLPGVICTQHIGPLTEQARHATAEEVLRIIRGFLISGEADNCLNLADQSPATWQLVVRVRDQVGVMAAILEAVRADGINAQEITSRVFVGAKAAWCAIALDERPSTEALAAIRQLPDVLHLELRAVV